VKRYKSTTILGGGPPGKIVQCQSFQKFLLDLLSKKEAIVYFSTSHYQKSISFAYTNTLSDDDTKSPFSLLQK
jgi:hypothetical protein